MLSTDDLRFFCVLAAQPSLAETARVLNVTPSSVSQRLQGIEDRLTLKLLNRQGRVTSLTDEGQLLAERARGILAEMDDLHDSLHDRKNALVGRLRILAPLGFGSEYVADLAAQFQARHPQVSVELVLSDSPNRHNLAPWDIVIHIGALRDSTMVQTVLARNRRFLCAAPGLPGAARPPEQHRRPRAARLHLAAGKCRGRHHVAPAGAGCWRRHVDPHRAAPEQQRRPGGQAMGTQWARHHAAFRMGCDPRIAQRRAVAATARPCLA